MPQEVGAEAQPVPPPPTAQRRLQEGNAYGAPGTSVLADVRGLYKSNANTALIV